MKQEPRFGFEKMQHGISEQEESGSLQKPAWSALRVAKKLLYSTGRAAWVAGTSLLVIAVPLIIEMDREAQLVEAEAASLNVLGAAAPKA